MLRTTIRRFAPALAAGFIAAAAQAPYAGGRLGTKQDVQNHLQFMLDVSAAVKEAAAKGDCWDKAMKDLKLPKYEKWGGYSQFFAGNVERYCSYWARGY
jgi:hypothetical protein